MCKVQRTNCDAKSAICNLQFIICFLALFANAAYAQPGPGDIKKTKSSAVIDGVFYYLHTVEKGQTLYSISKVYEVKVEEITSLNADAVTSIKPGQILKIPYKEKEKANMPKKNLQLKGDYFYYKVEQGETLYGIAQKHGLKVDEVLKYNPDAIDGVKTGDLLAIPGLPKEIQNTNEPVNLNDIKKDKEIKQVKPELKTNTSFNGNQPTDNEFRMAVFLPFYLIGLDNIEPEKIKKNQTDFPEKSRIAVEFYNGILLALDSMKKQGLNVTLDVFDTGNDSTIKLSEETKSKLSLADCIIGPLYTNNFSLISAYAKQKNIPIISALSQNNKILLGNEWVIKATPSVITQVEQMAFYIGNNYATENIMMLGNNNPKETVYSNTIKNGINTTVKNKNSTDTVMLVNTLKGIADNLKPGKINIIIITNSNPSQTTDLLSKLNKMKDGRKDSILVFGMNAWQSIESIDIEYLNNLHVHIPETHFVNYTLPGVKQLIANYRTKYKTEPTEYSYHGFDLAYYFMAAYKKYGEGNIMENFVATNWQGSHSGYWFYKSSVESGYENKSVFILQYANSTLIKVNK
jgi:LysM repeat protein